MMTGTSDEEMSLKAYLLGELAPDKQRRVEERLLLDRDYVEMLLIIEEELMDSYLSSTLSDEERNKFEQYFLSTSARRRKLRMAKALRKYINNSQPVATFTPARATGARSFWGQLFASPAWRSAVATMLVLGLGLGIWQSFFHKSLADKGRAALQDALRESPTEARMAGFKWPPRQVRLGEQSDNIANKPALESAGRYSLDAVAEEQDSDAHHALGQVYMAKGELDSAIEQFEQALKEDPKNARLYSDLGAALLERADNSRQDFDYSLKYLDRALELDDSLLEAWFNRALNHEYSQRPSEAENDWKAYLERDSNSRWADEARRRLKILEDQRQKTSRNNKEQLKEFLSAYETGDRKTAWKIVSQTREVTDDRLIWRQLLDDFFGLRAAGWPFEADARIEALRYVGKLELHLGEEEGQGKGDPYVSELAEFYRSMPLRQQAVLLDAHERMNKGIQLYQDNENDKALDNYIRAREGFARIHNRGEAMLADLLIGHCHFQNGETELSLSLFKQLIEECRERGYRWLLAQTYFGLGMVQGRLAEHSEALESTSRSLEISEEISDTYNIQRSLAQIADQYRKLGNYEMCMTFLNRCLKQVSAAWPGNRQMWRTCDQLIQFLTARGFDDAAAAYAGEAVQLALGTGDSALIYVSYIHLALILSRQQNYVEAIKMAQKGLAVAPNPADRVYAYLQLGQLHRQAGDLPQALDYYGQSIKYINEVENTARPDINNEAAQVKTDRLPALRYEAYKGRLSCLFEQGKPPLVQEEIAQTETLLDGYRKNIREEQNRSTFFNVQQPVYDAIIDFEHSRRNDNKAAFEYSEKSRARSLLSLITTAQAQVEQADGQRQVTPLPISDPPGLDEVRRRLPDKTQLIEYVVLADKLLIFLVSKSEFSVEEVEIRASELSDKVSNFRQAIWRNTPEPIAEARELYDLLIGRIKLSPEKSRQICIVPDKVLSDLPFIALVSPDSGKCLVQDYQVTVAPSAAVYLACSERIYHTADRAQERLLAVGDPTFDRTAFDLPALPSTRRQVEKIAEFYSSPSVLTRAQAREETVKSKMEESDVIHLASHYVVDKGDPMKSRLLLAQERGDSGEPDSSAGVLEAGEVYGLKLRRAPLVVLSACETGVELYYNGEGMIGMSRVFIAAGAPVVVASLWKVDAYATDELMINFHRHRKLKGLSTSEALRLAQMDMLSDPSRKHPYYWAGFAAIGGQTNF